MARVMIADDNNEVRIMLRDMITACKHQVVAEAVNGIEAIEKFNLEKPDVLLLDISMPKKDGKEVLIEIMKNKSNSKVIMLTAHDDMEIIEDCVKAGALAYITKPVNGDEIIQAISFAHQEK